MNRLAKCGKSRNCAGSGSGGPLHRETHYCRSAIFLPESSLVTERDVLTVIPRPPFVRHPSPSNMIAEQVQIPETQPPIPTFSLGRDLAEGPCVPFRV